LTKKKGEEIDNEFINSAPTGSNGSERFQRMFSFSSASDSHSNLSPCQLTKERNQGELYNKILLSSNLKNYFYLTQSFLDDFDELIVAQRIEHLEKYCKYKAKKWLHNRER